MELQYFGLSCFKFKIKDSTILTDPFNPKDVGLSYPIMDVDAVVFSSKDDSGRYKPSDLRAAKSLDIVKISGSGEFEVGGVFISGYDHAPFYVISYKDINVCYLGLLKGEIKRDLFEDIGDIDYLILPVGDGDEFVNWKDLEKIISEIDPFVIIPSCYSIDGMKDKYNKLGKLEDFLKEFGLSNPIHESKIKLKHYVDTETRQTETIILDPKSK